MNLAVGMASGLGNAVFMLPAIKAICQLGHSIALYVQTDFPTADLWRRCVYADTVLEPPAVLNGWKPVCGQWRPAAWAGIGGVVRHETKFPYKRSETVSNMKLAEGLGWTGLPPDVSDWCRDLDRTPRWDVGIVPGSKIGVWLRKRYPQMDEVAQHFMLRGKKVAVFGLAPDGVEGIPGEAINSDHITELPDLLAGCRVIIGTDSGPTHLAASLGIPTVVVYTATSEIKGDPVGVTTRKLLLPMPCRPCQTTPSWNACHNWRCRGVPVETIISAADELLAADGKVN